jgi:hypothetical protein
MTAAYRDENESLRARNAELETELADRKARIEELEQKIGDNDAVFERLRGVIDQKPAKRWSHYGVGALVTLVVLGIAGAGFALTRSKRAEAAGSPLEPPRPQAHAQSQAAPATPIDPKNHCERPGIRITVDGSDAEALAVDERDGSGSKYRRNGDRALYFTVNGGNLYIHGWGNDMPGDTGTSDLTLFSIMTKGQDGGYRLARDGRSMLEVIGNDGKNAWGRFEADMSKVDDVTREAPFGTPVVRVRGNFCLPFRKGNPSDTGP